MSLHDRNFDVHNEWAEYNLEWILLHTHTPSIYQHNGKECRNTCDTIFNLSLKRRSSDIGSEPLCSTTWMSSETKSPNIHSSLYDPAVVLVVDVVRRWFPLPDFISTFILIFWASRSLYFNLRFIHYSFCLQFESSLLMFITEIGLKSLDHVSNPTRLALQMYIYIYCHTAQPIHVCCQAMTSSN